MLKETTTDGLAHAIEQHPSYTYGYPTIAETDPVDFLRRGCIPVSRPPDELVRYCKTLENIVGIYTNSIDFKMLHESAVPHWVDVLEGVE